MLEIVPARYQILSDLWRRFYTIAESKEAPTHFAVTHNMKTVLNSSNYGFNGEEDGAFVKHYPYLAADFYHNNMSVRIEPGMDADWYGAQLDGKRLDYFNVIIRLGGDFDKRYRKIDKHNILSGVRLKFSVCSGIENIIISPNVEWLERMEAFMLDVLDACEEYCKSENKRYYLPVDIFKYIEFVRGQFGVEGTNFQLLIQYIDSRNNVMGPELVPNMDNLMYLANDTEALAHASQIMEVLGGYKPSYMFNEFSMLSGKDFVFGVCNSGLDGGAKFYSCIGSAAWCTEAKLRYDILLRTRGFETIEINKTMAVKDVSVPKLKTLVDFMEVLCAEGCKGDPADPTEVTDDYIDAKLMEFKRLYEDYSGEVIDIKRVEK